MIRHGAIMHLTLKNLNYIGKRVQDNRWGPGDDSVNNKQVHLPCCITGPGVLMETAPGQALQLECPETENPGGGSTHKQYSPESPCAPLGLLSEG